MWVSSRGKRHKFSYLKRYFAFLQYGVDCIYKGFEEGFFTLSHWVEIAKTLGIKDLLELAVNATPISEHLLQRESPMLLLILQIGIILTSQEVLPYGYGVLL